jgi:hypothetical protein
LKVREMNEQQRNLADWIRDLHQEKGLSERAIFDHFGGSVPLVQIQGILNPRADSDHDGDLD